jgi:hypothetical protein
VQGLLDREADLAQGLLLGTGPLPPDSPIRTARHFNRHAERYNQAKAGSMATLGILDLLKLRGYDDAHIGKMVRHKDARYDIHDLIRHQWLEAYQGYQSRPIFDGCTFVLSFAGGEGTKARFLGVYRVIGKRDGHQVQLPSGCPHTEWRDSQHFYELRREPGYEDLENRVIIEWGKGALAWHQRITNKEVIEILPKGQRRPPFRDYLEFTLTHDELVDLCTHQDANSEWRARLSAVAGVYLILATTTGVQYVGSAYGVEGIWGRWAAYAHDGHGGNKMLKDLLASDPDYPKGFSYSVLQILPKTFARSEVLEWEARYKGKLGSRAHGLNAN